MERAELSKRLVSVIAKHPNCNERGKLCVDDSEAGEWGLAIAGLLRTALTCDIPIPDKLLLEAGNYLDMLKRYSGIKAYKQLLERAGLPVSEALAASAAEEREEIARINPGWQY